MKELRPFERRARRALLIRVGTVLLAALLVLALAVFNTAVGFRTLLPAYALAEREEGEFRLHFLSVGQADCTLVEFPDGHVLFVDSGGGTWQGNNHIFRYWKGLGSPDCDLLVTHTASDHAGGVPFLLNTLHAKTLYYPSVFSASSLKEAAVRAGVPCEPFSRSFVYGDENGYLVCLSPRSEEDEEANDCSAVLYLRYAGVGVLLTGDISSERERLLVRESALGIFTDGLPDGFPAPLWETDILKAAHHGSGSSSCEEWLSLVRPETAVISCGAGNSYGHPDPAVTGRLSSYGEIYRTDELGDVLVTISPGGTYRVEYARHG